MQEKIRDVKDCSDNLIAFRHHIFYVGAMIVRAGKNILLPAALLLFISPHWVQPSSSIAEIKREIKQDQSDESDRLTAILNLIVPPRNQLPSSSIPPVKCATSHILEITNHSRLLSPVDINRLVAGTGRPTLDFVYDTPQGHFKIHYDASGEDRVYQAGLDIDPADGHPDFVNRVGAYFEHARDILINRMGYLPPPGDFERGGDSRYDVYLRAYPRAYGATLYEHPSNQYPDHTTWTSFIQIHPNFENYPHSPDASARITSAHEWFHAVQGAYCIDVQPWFMEATATWFEDVVWDEVNDYYFYLPDFFENPHLSLLTLNGVHEYASCLWPHFLEEKFGRNMLREIWQSCIRNDLQTAVTKSLQERNISFEATFAEFTCWNYFTGSRILYNLPHYQEASDFPILSPHLDVSQYPAVNITPHFSLSPEVLAANYVSIVNDGLSTDKLVYFSGSTNTQWQLNAIVYRENGVEILKPIFDSLQWCLEMPASVRQIILIPSVLNRISGDHSDYSVAILPVQNREMLMTLEHAGVRDLNVNDDNERLEAGETGHLYFDIINSGPVWNDVMAVLKIEDEHVHVLESTLLLPQIKTDRFRLGGDTGFRIQVNSSCPVHSVSGTLTLLSQNTKEAVLSFTFPVGFPGTLLVSDTSDRRILDFYENALYQLGTAWERVELDSSAEETLYLHKRHTMIWITDSDSAHLAPLKEFTAKHKSLLLIAPNLSRQPFSALWLADYFQCDFAPRVNSAHIQGEKGDYISRGESASFSESWRNLEKDALLPRRSTQSIFHYPEEGSAAAVKREADFRALYFAFPLHELVENHSSFLSPKDIFIRSLLWLNGIKTLAKNDLQPPRFRLIPNYPNPFNARTVLPVEIDRFTPNFTLTVYSIKGQRVRTLYQGPVAPGSYKWVWDGVNDRGKRVGSGTYFVRGAAGSAQTKYKITLLR